MSNRITPVVHSRHSEEGVGATLDNGPSHDG